jgi:hypothetical protein
MLAEPRTAGCVNRRAAMPELATAAARWPFHRERPTCVVLDVRPGVLPSDLPPVRIFLGTEEAQYRAERIFFYSVEKVRDPARVYEIHLMKNVQGFDRSKWRTGFTNYRYAIPEWAGGQGRAIYNDVDQIYLADPALLFDLEMGNHGYLAISAKDTSVMLIDCGRMVDLWNIQTASTLGKHALIDKPSSTPGLWGELDGHWNARDQEYVEGRTRCLHYTALHQQPWEPFPEVYSYHPNPLAYIWHDLERAADADGYEVFTAAAPSPDFGPALARATAGAERPPAPGRLFGSLLQERAVADLLELRWPADLPTAPLDPSLQRQQIELGDATPWPEAAADAVVASNVLPHLPPADLPWLLHKLFAAARKLVHVDAIGTGARGLGSADWWRRRLTEIGARHPGKSWSLTVADKAASIPGTTRQFAMRTRPLAEPCTVWALLDGKPAHDVQVRGLAAATGFAVVEQRLETGLFGAVSAPRGSLDGPFPDLVVAAGPDAGAVARTIKAASRGKTRAVQIGGAGAFDRFDLVVANPAERLPIRSNTVEVTAPLVEAGGHAAPAGGCTLAILAPVVRPFTRPPAAAAALGRALAESARGQKAIWVADGVSDAERDAVLAAAGDARVLKAGTPLDEAIAGAGRLVTHGEEPLTLARLCASGKPVMLVPLPYWYDGIPGSKPVLNLLTLLIGGGTSYRGTPHQQHALGRLVDRLIAAGWLRLPFDPARLHRALIGRGLLHPVDATEAMASPHPLDDRERVVEAIRRTMTRLPEAA